MFYMWYELERLRVRVIDSIPSIFGTTMGAPTTTFRGVGAGIAYGIPHRPENIRGIKPMRLPSL